MAGKSQDEEIKNRAKDELRGYLIDARKSTKNMPDLVEKLENKDDFARYSNGYQYQTFCEAYIIELISVGVFDKYRREILLASFGLLEGYNELKIGQRRQKYFEQGIGANPLIDAAWETPLSSISDVEDAAIAELIKYLDGKEVFDDKYIGELNLAAEVVDKLSKEFPDGLPEKYPLQNPKYTLIPVEEIHPSRFDIKLAPGKIYKLNVAIIPAESYNAPLDFSCESPEFLSVSPTGMLSVPDESQVLQLGGNTRQLLKKRKGLQSVEVLVRSKQFPDIIATKLVTVDFSDKKYAKTKNKISSIGPMYNIELKVRVIGGEKVWSNFVYAKIGDTVEFQIAYKNVSDKGEIQSVTIRDILPYSLWYLADTTKLWNSEINGGLVSPDNALVNNGIKIGAYGITNNDNQNAYVRFRAEVGEEGLAYGINTLTNWAQGSVGDITIQDHASVIVEK